MREQQSGKVPENNCGGNEYTGGGVYAEGVEGCEDVDKNQTEG